MRSCMRFGPASITEDWLWRGNLLLVGGLITYTAVFPAKPSGVAIRVAFASLTLLACGRSWIGGVYAQQTGLLVRNFFRSYRVAWDEDPQLVGRGDRLGIQGRDGRIIELSVTKSIKLSEKGRVKETSRAIEAIERWIEQRGGGRP